MGRSYHNKLWNCKDVLSYLFLKCSYWRTCGLTFHYTSWLMNSQIFWHNFHYKIHKKIMEHFERWLNLNWRGFTQGDLLHDCMKCGGPHRHQSNTLKFSPAQDATVTSWARPQMPSATEVRRHVETTTTFVYDILTCTISWAQPNVI